MKVTFISHASILVEAGGVAVLSDPWWCGPCFGAQWWNYPLPYLRAVDDRPIDYIYVSHGHHDHFHPGTLATLPKTAKVLVSSALDLAPAVRELGFDVIEVDPEHPKLLGRAGLEVRIVPTHGDDTLMTLSDGREVCVNLNDALHSAPETLQTAFVKRLRSWYPRIDYVFCGYGVASHFPNCYRIPGKNAEATAGRRQAYFNRQWAKLIAGIAPRYGFPFAADVVLLQDDLFWANEATHNPERPTTVFTQQHPDRGTTVIDIAPGFQVADGQVTSMVTRQPLHGARIRSELREQVERANRVGQMNDAAVADVVRALEARLANCRDYLGTFEGDYRMALRFLNSPLCVVLQKRGKAITLNAADSESVGEVDLSYTTRWAYLRWALERPYGDELLFVGSGGIFDYASTSAAARALHRELITLIKNQPTPSRSLPAGEISLWRKIKRTAKGLLRRDERDLYDLLSWTEFDTTPALRRRLKP